MRKFKQITTGLWEKHKEVLLWAIGGGINTVLTYGLYLLLDLVLSYRIAFTASYVIGIIFAYFFNALVVFKSGLSLKKFLQFPLVYLVQYLLSIGLLEVLVQGLNINPTIAPIFVLIIVTPVTYLLSRWILKGKSTPSGEN
ncbi:MAG: GtrA family protein [Brevefilum sp.]|nr:GtrA family protein [Brevefilum sp.]